LDNVQTELLTKELQDTYDTLRDEIKDINKYFITLPDVSIGSLFNVKQTMLKMSPLVGGSININFDGLKFLKEMSEIGNKNIIGEIDKINNGLKNLSEDYAWFKLFTNAHFDNISNRFNVGDLGFKNVSERMNQYES
jgi:hypothetical protein